MGRLSPSGPMACNAHEELVELEPGNWTLKYVQCRNLSYVQHDDGGNLWCQNLMDDTSVMRLLAMSSF